MKVQESMYAGLNTSAANIAGLGVSGGVSRTLAEPKSALSENAEALAEARRLAYRVQCLVDRFCGSIPSAEGIEGSKTCVSVIFDEIREDAQRTAYDIRRAMDRLDHLEAQLP